MALLVGAGQDGFAQGKNIFEFGVQMNTHPDHGLIGKGMHGNPKTKALIDFMLELQAIDARSDSGKGTEHIAVRAESGVMLWVPKAIVKASSRAFDPAL